MKNIRKIIRTCLLEEFNKNKSIYKEIEFVCYNSNFKESSEAYKQAQIDLYNELKKIQLSSDYKILPYMQDFTDNNHVEISLAVIILDTQNEKHWENKIMELANKHQIPFDLYGTKTEHQVNGIIRGDYYNNIIKEVIAKTTLKSILLKRANEYSKHFKRTFEELNNGLCEEIALDVIDDIRGETSSTYMIDDGWFWDLDKISNLKTKSGEYWNVNNLNKYGKPPFDYKLLSKFDLKGHVWIYHNKKHYDIETLDGVINFWDLPIYKRQIADLNLNSQT